MKKIGINNIELQQKYSEVLDQTLKKYLEEMYKPSFSRGYQITDIVKLNDEKWIIRWNKKLLLEEE